LHHNLVSWKQLKIPVFERIPLQFVSYGFTTRFYERTVSINRHFKWLATLTLVPSGIILGFEQVGIAFRHEALVSSEILQDTTCLNHFLKTAEQ
jgi:hypothetical protein